MYNNTTKPAATKASQDKFWDQDKLRFLEYSVNRMSFIICGLLTPNTLLSLPSPLKYFFFLFKTLG